MYLLKKLNLFSSQPTIHLYSEAEEFKPHHNILLHYMHFNITLLNKINIFEILSFSSVQIIISTTCYLFRAEIFAVITLSLT